MVDAWKERADVAVPDVRVAAADVPIPSGVDLERAILPSVEKIVAAARKALAARG